MIERALVYIHSAGPASHFVGCGVLVEGGLVATCRHVWRMATQDAPDPTRVALVFPHARSTDGPVRPAAVLHDACDQLAPVPDLVLLRPDAVPFDLPLLPPSYDNRFQSGPGYVVAGLVRDADDPDGVEDRHIPCDIVPHDDSRGRRQFTGTRSEGDWVAPGSSGSPVFVDNGMQLAGILALAELPGRNGQRSLREAFIVPGTTIRAHLLRLQSESVRRPEGVGQAQLQPILDRLAEQGVKLDQIPAKLQEAVDALLAHGAEPLPASNADADIEATRAASRDRLRALDTEGARAVLQAKIDEEAETRARRLLPLLRERAEIERLAFDHAAAAATFAEIVQLAPDDVWAHIALGRLWQTIGSLERAAGAFRSAREAARRIGDQRDEGVAGNRLGDVLLAEGDREAALDAYRASLTIAEALAGRDPGNTQWQRDLSVSHDRIGDVLRAEGDLAAALDAYRAALAIAEALAGRDPGNTEWQRDLSVSHDRIGDVLLAEGDHEGGAGRLPRQPRHPRGAGRPRSGQHRVAARPLGQPQQDRRRAAGRGRPRGGAGRLPRQPRHPRGAGRPRSGQYRVAARPLAQPREDRRGATGRGRPRGGAGRLPRRPRHPRDAGRPRSG